MSFLIVPMFCASVGFVVFLGASGILINLRRRKPRGSNSTRRERKAARVIGVAAGLGLALNLLGGSALNGSAGIGVDVLILLVTVGWVWRILKMRTAVR